MLKDIKLPLNMSFMEVITVSSFIGIGYLFIYRYSFYNTLGIPWYITTITPLQILSGSIKVLFNLFIGMVIGVTLIKFTDFFKDKKEKILLFSMLILLILLAIILISENGVYFLKIQSILNNIELSIPSIIHYIIILLMIRLTIRMGNSLKVKVVVLDKLIVPEKIMTPVHVIDKHKSHLKEFMLTNSILLLVIMILTPISMGEKDSVYLLENRDKVLNHAVIKGDLKKWYLIEVVGDKALLIAENRQINEFKLIEYKELEKLIAPKKSDIDSIIIQKVKNIVNQ